MDGSRKSRSRSPRDGADAALRCPRCALDHPLEERFCGACGMPLVHASAATGRPPEEDGEARDYARKIRPEFARGELVRVAGGRNQAEAELIRGMLIEEGVPSMVRRSAGFDVPDFLAGGPRDVVVPSSGVAHARAALGAFGPPPEATPTPASVRRAAQIGAAVVGVGALGAALAWAAIQLGG